MSIVPRNAPPVDTDSGEYSSRPSKSAPPRVPQAVDTLCALCGEQWKDYLHARAGQREADHRSQQLAQELHRAEEAGYLDDHALHALSTEAEDAVRLLRIRTIVAENTADRVAEAMVDCLRCLELAEVLFPDAIARADFGGAE